MMDSQEKALEQGQNEVIKEEEVNAQAVETPADETASQVETKEEQPQKVYATKAEILERVREIAHGDEAPQKEEVDNLKTAFYKFHIAEREAHIKAFIDGGGDPNQYQIVPDSVEEAFKAEMGIIKEKRAKLFKEQEAEKQENLTKKLAIIDKIKSMITTPEEANKSYQEFKTLQQQWREIKNVPAEKANELWRNYQLYVEQFYDMLRLNSIARDEDFKKNLEAKTRLCEIAENLANEEDIISAFHQLQKLHQEYREIGPVAKEQREEIWNRFKAASTVINKRHQQHFEGIRAREEDNLARKTVLCEKVEAIAAEENKGSGDWEKHTKAIIDIQAEWKTIGFAPQKMNVKIFERFRGACDEFFKKKSEYFKAAKARMNENLEKKRALVERVEALKDSKEWKETAEELVKLQKEWKSIGPVAKRYSDALWKRFIAACDYFFEQKGEATSSKRSVEGENLKRKKAIIEELKELLNKEESEENTQQINKLMAEWNEVGHVPFKEKDKIYEQYRELADKLRKTFNLNVASKKFNKFRAAVSKAQETGVQAVYREREKLVRNYENLLNELHTYENNFGFLNATSKSGNSLLTELSKKMDKLKVEIEAAKEKIRHIDEDIQQEDEKAE